MTKLIVSLVIIIALTACGNNEETATVLNMVEEDAAIDKIEKDMKGFYDFKTKTLMEEDFDFSDLKGKRVLVVNTASECGYTPQYKQLQGLQDEFGGEKFTIIGFPSNDFGGQEPGNNAEIAAFCQKNYGVSFPMMAKTPVTGANKHPVYSWLTEKAQNGVDNVRVEWNFNKFLIDENGNWVAYYPSSVTPLDEKITDFASGE